MARKEAEGRIVAIPYLGGNQSSFGELMRSLPRSVSLTTLCSPGHGCDQSSPLESMEALSDYYLERAWDLLDKDTVLFGHSMGALLAFMILCKWEKKNEGARIKKLVLSGSNSPLWYASHSVEQLRMTDREVIDYLQSIGGLSPLIANNTEVIQYFMPAIRSDFRALATMSYTGERVKSPALILRIQDDLCVEKDEPARWLQCCSGEAELRPLGARGHFYFRGEPEALKVPLLQCLLC